MKKQKKKVPGEQGKQICLTKGQLKTLFDEARGEETCDTAADFIQEIDEEFETSEGKKTKKKKKKSFIERWF